MREEKKITRGPSGKRTNLEIEKLTEDQQINCPEYPDEIII